MTGSPQAPQTLNVTVQAAADSRLAPTAPICGKPLWAQPLTHRAIRPTVFDFVLPAAPAGLARLASDQMLPERVIINNFSAARLISVPYIRVSEEFR